MITTSAAPALTMMPLVPAERMPASVPSPLIVIALVMATAPKLPGSSTDISPRAAVLEIAPANVLHGAVRLQGLASSPTPETQVLVAWACAAEVQSRVAATNASGVSHRTIFMGSSPLAFTGRSVGSVSCTRVCRTQDSSFLAASTRATRA